jgi:hypothetical protein
MLHLHIHPVWSKLPAFQGPIYGRVTAPQFEEGAKGVVLEKILELIPRDCLRGGAVKHAWSEKQKKLFFADGGWIQFKSAEQAINTFGGVKLHYCWDDEHIPLNYFMENVARLADYGGVYFKSMTPEAGAGVGSYERDLIMYPPEKFTVDEFVFFTKKNPYLKSDYIAAMESLYRDPMLRAIKMEGEYAQLSGLVYPMFNWNIHGVPDRELHPYAVRVCLGDFHTRTPSAILWAAWEPDKKWGTKIAFYRAVKMFKTVPEWVNYLRATNSSEKIDYWLGDESESETGQVNIHDKHSILEQFRQLGIPFEQVDKGKGSFQDGVFKVRSFLNLDPLQPRNARLEVFKSLDIRPEFFNGKPQYSMRWEFENYAFRSQTKADEESLREHVRNIDDHFVSLARYAIQAGPFIYSDDSQSFKGVQVYGN